MGDKRILTVGLTCVDIITVVKKYPKEDTDQRIVDHRWHRGGNASNSCTVLSLLGRPCECLATLAVSPELSFIEQDLRAYNIDTDHMVYHEGHSTPLSIVMINAQNGSRTILHGNKGLPELTLENFKAVDLSSKRYKWIHFEARPTVDEVCRMLEHVDEYNATISDAADRITTSVELEKCNPEIEKLAGRADFVFLSKDYARYIGYQSKEEVAEEYTTRCRPGAGVICAWGEDGAIARAPDGSIYSSPIFPPDRVVDTLGAGDTFNAATIALLSEGRHLGDAIRFGCRVAGAKCGMQGFDGLAALFGKEAS